MNEHPSEHQEQVAFFAWAGYNLGRWPVLGLMFAIPNGGRLTHQMNLQGARYSLAGQWLVAEGMKRGVPDVFLPVSRGGYHGLFIEMKSAGGKISQEQKTYIEALRTAGYSVSVCYGCDEAIETIVQYLEMDGEDDGGTERNPD